MKYPIKNKEEKPLFNYLVRSNFSHDYYLFEAFDDALKQARSMSFLPGIEGKIILIYENYFNVKTREWHAQQTFMCIDGIMEYEKHGDILLHIEFYLRAGQWLNPNQKWIDSLELANA